MTELLTVDNIHTYYDRSHILQGVSLRVRQGQIVTLLGRNGAGKSTTIRSIMGVNPPRTGEIVFDNTDIARKPPYYVARRGIAYVPETRGIFPSLTVFENLTLAARQTSDTGAWDLARIHDLFPVLKMRRHNGGTQLSGGEQQMLSIARALMLNPRMLVLDEPTEGLAPVVIGEIGRVLRALKDDGMTMLLVEQNYPFATALADYLYVLGKGRIRWQGNSAQLADTHEIRHTWLGV
uniref:Amino acid/amide ABC transporter ATP-binding protein 2, HAAT family n=1 Tax=Candidatus Kentrum sp. FW TaxID=2126338 RepID=A0A450SEU4_9GAMM|nr:MAG: amino acid/amide ABC transporter ATP-binding protein 2, HAAT family [Candidatus Kentron sp. FW]VFJ59099.1 MAG: amino acid/amide ABC transporter ATP-binding protein 2, HAAT family [Candidatus Kentron sp. FW]